MSTAELPDFALLGLVMLGLAISGGYVALRLRGRGWK